MSNISVYLAQILSAVYGKDVREAIHNAIESIHMDLEDTNNALAEMGDEYFSKKGGTVGDDDGMVDIYGNHISFNSSDSYIYAGSVTARTVNAQYDVVATRNGEAYSLVECFQSVSSGKELIAAAITDKGIRTAKNVSFAAMASNIGKLGETKNTAEFMDFGLSFVPDNVIYES